MDSRLHFDETKAVQVTGRLMELSGKRSMSKSKVAKLLYLVDREAIQVKGRPVIGGRYVSTPHDGPLIGQCLEALESGASGRYESWERSFGSEGKLATLKQPTGCDALSKRELAIIESVHLQYDGMTATKLHDFTHDLPKYEDPKGCACEIPLERLVQAATGRSPEMARSLVRDIAGAEFFAGADLLYG